MKANHTDTTATWGRVASPITVTRGQFITGRFALHEGCYPDKRKNKPSPSKVWRILQSLEKAGKVTIKTNSQYSTITICHYETYQSDTRENEQRSEQQVNSGRTASEQQVNTDKNVKNANNVKKGGTSFIVPSVEEVKAYCKEKGYGVDAESFVAFYESKGWMVGKNKMKKWQAAVLTWEKKNRSSQPDKPAEPPLLIHKIQPKSERTP